MNTLKTITTRMVLIAIPLAILTIETAPRMSFH